MYRLRVKAELLVVIGVFRGKFEDKHSIVKYHVTDGIQYTQSILN